MKQHIIPKTYLSWFTNDKGLVNFFDRDNSTYKEQNPKTVTRIPDFYTLYNEDWTKNYSIEKFLSENIENYLPTLLNKIKRQEELNSDDKELLASFITFQYLRTEVFRGMNWVFMVASKKTSFLTSDNPLSTYTYWYQEFLSWGFLEKNTVKIIPISSGICLNMFSSEGKQEDNIMMYTKISKKSAMFYNWIIALNSYRVLIWRDKKLLEKTINRMKLKDIPKFDSIEISWPLWTR